MSEQRGRRLIARNAIDSFIKGERRKEKGERRKEKGERKKEKPEEEPDYLIF